MSGASVDQSELVLLISLGTAIIIAGTISVAVITLIAVAILTRRKRDKGGKKKGIVVGSYPQSSLRVNCSVLTKTSGVAILKSHSWSHTKL